MIDQMKMSDQVIIQLSCDHEFTGGEMKCRKCGQYFAAAPNIQSVDTKELEIPE